ncbi:50S ribosomal protein L14 [Candidatus Gromoviella agglomerans]|uniref:50S ribosomal protein L14 n=1 Tax=Candidatus Gromoviella agglomerans TaxID=2806609 RepID=UPI001E2E8CC7|nr:50S ribosomal protein L14 [Candidatus Gromoviella agglomerans]UFX98569.1 50S ribosomal protein L14 [Candidatus Gromoviella agglomerans]
MIRMESCLSVIDNTGAKIVKCIKVLGGSRRKFAKVGDIIVASVQEVTPDSSVKKGAVVKVAIVSTKNRIPRFGGVFVRFDTNAAVIVSAQGAMVGTRVLKPISRLVKVDKVASRAMEVI